MADAPLSEIIDLQIAVATLGIPREGFGVPLILSCNAQFAERVRIYTDIADVAADFATSSPEYRAASAMFDQDPHPAQVYIGRAVGKPTLAYQINVSNVAVGDDYTVDVAGEGVTTTEVAYTPKADIASSFLPRVSNVLTQVAHGMSTGDGPYRFSTTGGLPTGLAVDTNYWIHADTVDTLSFAISKANALAGTVVALSGDGTGVQTLRRCENDVICAQIVQGLNAVPGKNYTAAQVTGAGETDYVTVTANTAGAWFGLGVPQALLKLAATHALPSPAPSADLIACNQEQPGFYGVYTIYNSDAYVKDVAAYVEGQSKIYVADIADTEMATLAAGGGDTADDLKVLAYERTATNFRPDPSDMGGAAWLGSRLPTDPGSETWMFAPCVGCADANTTTTQRTNIYAKHGNVLATSGGFTSMREGTMCDGGFIDTRRGIDWIQDDMVKTLAEILFNAKYKIPMTDAGVAVMVAGMKNTLTRAQAMGIIVSFDISFPKIGSVAASDKSIRDLTGLKFTAVLAGAIHKVTIRGLVTL
jgi:hypothetical protein